MAFAIKPGKSIRRQLIRLERKELSRASRLLLACQNSEAVHDARTSVKKAEAIVAVAEQLGFATPRKDERRLQAGRHALSVMRDADVLVDTFDRLHSHLPGRIPEHTAALVRALLARARDTTEARAQQIGRLSALATALRKTRRSATRWAVPSVDPKDLPPVITRAYRASRNAMRRARERRRMDDFHRWRKRVKTLWYHLRLASRLIPGCDATINQLKKLERTLGEEHNVAVLGLHLSSDAPLRRLGSKSSAPYAAAAAREKELRHDALEQGRQLLADPPKRFEQVLRRRLKTARAKHHARPRHPRAA